MFALPVPVCAAALPRAVLVAAGPGPTARRTVNRRS